MSGPDVHPTPPMGIDEATERVLQAFLVALDDADEDDTIRPRLVIEAIGAAMGVNDVDAPEMTVAEMRARTRRAMADLAHGRGPSADDGAALAATPKEGTDGR